MVPIIKEDIGMLMEKSKVPNEFDKRLEMRFGVDYQRSISNKAFNKIKTPLNPELC